MRLPRRRPLLIVPVAAVVAAAGLTAVTTTAASAAVTDLRINEVESSAPGDASDWVELTNTGATPVDAGGLLLKDQGENNTSTVPAGTTVAPGAFVALDVSGLGGGDTARLFQGGTLIDSYTWTTAAATTYGRCPDGTGEFVATQAATKGTANACQSVVAEPWPGGNEVATVDPQGTFSGNLSGLAYEPSGTAAPGALWAVGNNPGILYRLQRTGATWAPSPGWTAGKELRFAGGGGNVDSEGVTLTDGGSTAGVYTAVERDNDAGGSRPSVIRYNPAAPGPLTPLNEWNLTADLPGLSSNGGLEAITWVPDSYLTAAGLVDDNTGVEYSPESYANHGNGLFLVGVEDTGEVVAYALDHATNTYTRVTAFASGFPAVMELYYEAETELLWVVCDDTCQGRTARFDVAGGDFAPLAYHERPGGMPNLNNEGFTLAPRAECVSGFKPALWADDSSSDGHAIRQGTVSCTPPSTPGITAAVSPAAPPASGWYDAPVTVTFTCTPQGSPIADCPDPVRLTTSGAGQTASGTVVAEDGGTATATVTGLDIDLTAPRVSVAGVRNGATYPAAPPKPRCAATDPLSGVATCTLKTTRAGLVATVTATAVDKAGNTASTAVRYRLPAVQVVGATFVKGRYVVKRGRNLTLRALLAAAPAPVVLGPVRDGAALPARGPGMRRGPVAGGLTTWTRVVRVKGSGPGWRVVVKQGARRHTVKLRVG